MRNQSSLSVLGLVALVAAPGAVTAQPLEMSLANAPKATAPNSIVSRYGTDYQDYVTLNCGSNFVNCLFNFSTLTRNIRFTRISCAGVSSNVPTSLTLSNNGNATIPYAGQVSLPVAPTTYALQLFGTKYVYYMNINQEINTIMRKDTTPYINFYTLGSNAYETLTIRCLLTGTII